MNYNNFLVTMAAVESNFETKAKSTMALDLWFDELKDLDYMICQQAIKKLYRSHDSRFVSVGDIRNAYLSITDPKMPFAEAYQLMNDTIRNYGRYEHKKAMDNLKSKNPAIHTVVRAIGYQALCNSGAQYTRGTVEKMYNEITKNGMEKLLLGGFQGDIEKLRLTTIPRLHEGEY